MEDADLATHLLHMCPAKWQTKYNLMENTIHVSTRALLLVLKNIKSNAEVDYKAQNPTKTKGSKGKCKMKSINLLFPRSPRRWAGLTSIAFTTRSMEAIQKP